MKTFAGNKPLDEILAQCHAQGVPVDTQRFTSHGSDYITLGERGRGQVLYNTFNGRFHGTTPEGVEFNSEHDTHDDEPWFQALLSFFYAEKAATA